MNSWYMLTLVGEDRPGIVAAVTDALFQAGANLGEASMMRLGGNFSIMLMVQHDAGVDGLCQVLKPVAERLGLYLHVDESAPGDDGGPVPEVRITVFGADRAGIVSRVTNALLATGFNILDLESDVAGTAEAPIYIMHIEGVAAADLEAVRAALAPVEAEGVDVQVSAIETLIG